MNNRYERVYEVSLLDDLHNYFPALLYEPDRFRTVSDVLGYIGQNSSRRFNLFDYGRRQYLQEQTIRNQRNTGSPVEQNTFTRQTPIVNRWRSSAPVRETTHFEFDLSSEDDLSLLFPSLRNINRLATVSAIPTQPSNVNRIATLFQDIIIHASQELINNTSSVRTLLMDLEESCSICQDRMRQGENIRRLNACQHEFHDECVDNWFLHRSVVCPICRHDIRDTTPIIRSPLIAPRDAPTEDIPVSTISENQPEQASNNRLRSRDSNN